MPKLTYLQKNFEIEDIGHTPQPKRPAKRIVT